MTSPRPASPLPATEPPADSELAAAQAALAGEHACVYGYGVVGAHLPGDAEPAHAALARHRARRDELAGLVSELGGQPVAALSGYELPAPVTDRASAAALAAELESRLCALYVDLVGAERGRLRELAARAVVETSVQATRWGAEASAWPGLEGRLDATPTPSESPTSS